MDGGRQCAHVAFLGGTTPLPVPTGPRELVITVATEVGNGPTLLAKLDDAERETAGGGAGTEEEPAGGAGELGRGMFEPVGTGTPGTDASDDALPGQ